MEGDQEDSNEGSTRGEYATLDDEGRLHKKKKAVKRFRTAYILFSTVKHKEFREKLTAEKKQNGQKDNPIQSTEIAKLVSESWKSLPPEERAVWDKKAEEDRRRYQDEVNASHNTSMTSGSRDKDKNTPKRPMSAFLAYSNCKRAALKRENPKLKNGEMSTILSQRWKKESEEERQKYIVEARELRKQHKFTLRERDKKARKLEKDKIKRQRKEQEAEAKRLAEQARLDESKNSGDTEHGSGGAHTCSGGAGAGRATMKAGDAPKRPVSAFLEYSNGKRAGLKRVNPSLSNGAISKILSDQWRAEDPSVRQRYLDAAYHRRVKHKKALDAWRKEREKENNGSTDNEPSMSNDRAVESIQETTAAGPLNEPPAANASDPPLTTSQGLEGVENVALSQHGSLSQNGPPMLGIQPGLPSLQPINAFAAAPPGLGFDFRYVPSMVYLPVWTLPNNAFLQGNHHAVAGATPLNTNLAASGFPLLPVPDTAGSMISSGNNTGLNEMPVSAITLNSDGNFVQQNSQSLYNSRQLQFFHNRAASSPSVGQTGGMTLPDGTAGDPQQVRDHQRPHRQGDSQDQG